MTFELGLIGAAFIFTWWQTGKEVEELKSKISSQENKLTERVSKLEDQLAELKQHLTNRTFELESDLRTDFRNRLSEVEVEISKLKVSIRTIQR